ncbi:MAG TPA: IPT/TIG domain-containing protein [Candidatus Acidoferrales bacterium]|jgi:hypothetical protein|nr:IPT/TIG domain-containing protein [Candidatus Acidoferrales bacterium]
MNRSLLLFLLLGGAMDCRLADAQSPLTCSVSPKQAVPTVRAEGLTELVGDVLITCTGGTPVSAGAAIPAFDIKLSFNANVTSRIVGIDGTSSEALLLLDEPAPGAQFPCDLTGGVCPGVGNGNGNLTVTSYYGGGSQNRNIFQGVVSAGTALVWKAVPFDPPGAGQVRTFRFTNIRLDATSLPGGAGALTTTGISTIGTIPVTSNSVDGSILVATAQASLVATVRDAANAGTSSGETVEVSAAANVARRVATLRFAGAFPGADKARTAAAYFNADTSPAPVSQNVPGGPSGTETGFYNATFGTTPGGNLGAAGLADSGTRYMAVINNIPDGFNVFVDVNNSTGRTGTGPSARLINTDATGAGPFAPAAGSDNKVQLAVSGGTAIAVWEVLRTQPVGTGLYDFGVYLSYPASGSAATAPAPTGIQMMFAPTGGHASPPTAAIPVFDGTAINQNLFTYTVSADAPDPNAPPAMTVSPQSLSFTSTVGGQNPPPQYLQIISSSQPLGFSISSGGTIPLQPLPAIGVGNKLVTVSIDPTGLAAGASYNDTLSVTNTVDGTVIPVSVTYTLNPTPQILTLGAPSVPAGGPDFTLTVNGANFTGACAIRWNGTVVATTYVSAVQLTAQIPAALIAATGSAAITVSTLDGAVSNSTSLSIETFAISSLLPAGGFAGDAGFSLTITGSGFPTGATVTFAGTVLQPSSVSSTQITADIPASLVAIQGAIPVSVSSPGGSVSNWLSYTVAPIFLTQSVVPSVVMVGGPSFTLEIYGAGFIAGTTVQVGSAQLRPNSLAPGRIVVTVQAAMIAQAGSLPISVVRPDLLPSNGLTLTVSALPAITSLDPASVNAKSPSFTLTVAGVGFMPGATIRWNAQALPTTMLSSIQLTAVVPADLVAWLGSALIDVSVGGNAFSSAAMIRINAPGPPTLTSVSPATITVGSAPISITLTGTGFSSGCAVVFTPPSADPVRVVTDSCSPTQVVVRLPGSVLGTAGTGQILVTNPDGLSSASMPVSLALPVFPFLSFAAPVFVPSGQDRPVTLILNGAYPVALHGTMTMTFTPDGDLPDDPAIQFQNGSRVFPFTIPAGTQPQIQVTMKSGTVAGQIMITPSFTTSSPDAKPQDGVAQRIQIARAAPGISLLTCTRTASGFVAVVEGFTNTREASQASFDLQSQSGDSLGTAQLGADATPLLFSGWFASSQAASTGGLFRYAQTFTPQFDASKIVTATVKLSNTIGASTTASCQLQ